MIVKHRRMIIYQHGIIKDYRYVGEMGMNFKHQGTVDCRQNIEMPGF